MRPPSSSLIHRAGMESQMTSHIASKCTGPPLGTNKEKYEIRPRPARPQSSAIRTPHLARRFRNPPHAAPDAALSTNHPAWACQPETAKRPPCGALRVVVFVVLASVSDSGGDFGARDADWRGNCGELGELWLRANRCGAEGLLWSSGQGWRNWEGGAAGRLGIVSGGGDETEEFAGEWNDLDCMLGCLGGRYAYIHVDVSMLIHQCSRPRYPHRAR